MIRPRVVVLTAMDRELRPLARRLGLRPERGGGPVIHRGTRRGTEIVAVVTGIGTNSARAVADRAIGAYRPDHALMVGIAGGVDPLLALRSVIDPARVIDACTGEEYRPEPAGGGGGRGGLLTSDELVNDPLALEVLRAEGIVAVDMETAAVGAVCQRHGVPWSVIRAISDRAEDMPIDPSGPRLLRDDGSADLRAAGRYFVRRPHRMVPLMRLARDVRVATQRAAAATVCWLDDRSSTS